MANLFKKLINKYCKYMPILKKFSESEYQSNRHLVKLILEKIDENQEEYLHELLDFLLTWLSNHILKLDRQIPFDKSK